MGGKGAPNRLGVQPFAQRYRGWSPPFDPLPHAMLPDLCLALESVRPPSELERFIAPRIGRPTPMVQPYDPEREDAIADRLAGLLGNLPWQQTYGILEELLVAHGASGVARNVNQLFARFELPWRTVDGGYIEATVDRHKWRLPEAPRDAKTAPERDVPQGAGVPAPSDPRSPALSAHGATPRPSGAAARADHPGPEVSVEARDAIAHVLANKLGTSRFLGIVNLTLGTQRLRESLTDPTMRDELRERLRSGTASQLAAVVEAALEQLERPYWASTGDELNDAFQRERLPWGIELGLDGPRLSRSAQSGAASQRPFAPPPLATPLAPASTSSSGGPTRDDSSSTPRERISDTTWMLLSAAAFAAVTMFAAFAPTVNGIVRILAWALAVSFLILTGAFALVKLAADWQSARWTPQRILGTAAVAIVFTFVAAGIIAKTNGLGMRLRRYRAGSRRRH